MNDHPTDRLVAGAATIDDDRVRALDLDAGQAALLAEILAAPAAESDVRRPRRSWVVLAAAAAVVLAIGVPTWLTRGGDAPSAIVAPQAEPAPAASSSLQLLIDEPGWQVQYVDVSTRDAGDIRFVAGARSLEVNRYPADSYDGYYQDRLGVSAPQPVTALGQTGAMFTYGPTDHAVILPVRDGSFLELRGQGSDLPAFLDLLGRLTPVSEQQWAAAMPASVVLPSEEARVTQRMLAGVPTPPGFDPATVRTGGTHGYYSFGARVTGAVVCGWIDAYRSARGSGDQPGMRAAADALSTSRSWKVLDRMNAEGDWPEAVWELSDQIAAGDLRSQDEYHDGLSCHR